RLRVKWSQGAKGNHEEPGSRGSKEADGAKGGGAAGEGSGESEWSRGRVGDEDSVGPVEARVGGRADRGAGAERPGIEPVEEMCHAPDAIAAASVLIGWLEAEEALAEIEAVGHRVVHGGPRHGAPEIVTPAMVAELRRLGRLDPDHMPGGLALLETL